jgi:hypothetical protein
MLSVASLWSLHALIKWGCLGFRGIALGSCECSINFRPQINKSSTHCQSISMLGSSVDKNFHFLREITNKSNFPSHPDSYGSDADGERHRCHAAALRVFHHFHALRLGSTIVLAFVAFASAFTLTSAFALAVAMLPELS